LMVYELNQEGHGVLCFSALSSTVATILTSLAVSFRFLSEVQSQVPDASRWLLVPRHQQIAAVIVLLSASNIGSLGILRLRLGNRTLLDFPVRFCVVGV
jgi:6-phosphogluconate dehydrogenase (decarboxylating)